MPDRRYGHPRTEEERKIEHFRKYGTTELPTRGTRLRKEEPILINNNSNQPAIPQGLFIIPEKLDIEWIKERVLSIGPLYTSTLMGFLSGSRVWMLLGLMGGMFVNVEKFLDWMKEQFEKPI